jgi:hypothetical protein
MSSIKRVSGNYDVYTDLMTVYGNLVVVGNSTSFASTNSTLKDNIITLNQGETGNGVSSDKSGIAIDRGVAQPAYWVFNEPTNTWQGLIGSNLAPVSGAVPTLSSHFVTLGWLQQHPVSVSGVEYSLTYVHNNALDSNQYLKVSGSNLHAYGVSIGQNTLQPISANSNLYLTGTGTGTVTVKDSIKFDIATAPALQDQGTVIYANTVGSGGTGLYFVNNSMQDELISKTRATVLALIFS